MKINNIYEFLIIALYIFRLGIDLAEHGKPKEEKFNFVGSLLGVGVWMTLLYLAGLFH